MCSTGQLGEGTDRRHGCVLRNEQGMVGKRRGLQRPERQFSNTRGIVCMEPVEQFMMIEEENGVHTV